MVNYGTIRSNQTGVVMDGDGSGGSYLNNFGIIDSNQTAIRQDGGTSETLTLRNHGTISAGFGADSFDAATSLAIDHIINRGLMIGAIELGGGNDSYDGRGGTVEGLILGGDGNDSFIMGAGIETIDGGAGADTLDFRSTAGIKVALDGSFANTGVAAGDSYTGIEVLLGSSTGADAMTGSSGANTLRGYGGADSLSGAGGNDLLFGGTGVDVLNRGLGNDQFCFAGLADCGDTIQDFSNVAGNNDGFRITAAGFGGGLVAGALAATQFQIRADNLAQDGDDRFIFRTSDTTLWFDADGNGAGGPVLVAHLQAGASMTFADILLV